MPVSHLLLIDDDQEDQEIFHAALREISATICYSYIENAKEALEALLQEDFRPDLIFLDLNMPQMTGEEMLEKLQANPSLQQLPVIVFTTSSDPATREAMMNKGAAGFITKPGDFYQLIDLLKPLLV